MKTYDVAPIVVSDESENISDLLANRAQKTPNLPLFAIESSPGQWEDVSAKAFEEQVISVAKGLIAAGIQPGQAVGIMSRTRYEWTVLDFAIWYIGAVSVPVYESSAPSQIEWILSDSDCVALFVENDEHKARFKEIMASAPLCRQVWTIDNGDIELLVREGRSVTDDEVQARRRIPKLSDLATIIYTSGTTGKPKGCELTHRGFVELSKNATLELPMVVKEGNSTLLFIPLAHVFARFISVLAVHGGVKVGHQPDSKNVGPAMASFKPHFLLAVPRVFEKVYNSAEQKAEAAGKGNIFRKAAYTAIAYSKALDTPKGPGLGLKIQHKLFDVLVYKKLRAAMGGRVDYAVSGGAPLGARLGHFYRAIGLIVLEGYGLTETTAPAMIGRPNSLKIGKVGRMLPGTGIKIAEDGEIWLRGINIMRGYWRNPAATAATMEGEWFKTGDIGELDEDGFLSITGRKKELIVTAGGKNVAPAPLEDPLRANPLIGQAIVVGDQKPFVAALISLDPEMLPMWLANHGLNKDLSLAEAAKEPAVIAEIQTAVDRVNKSVSKAESIRKFVVLTQELSEDSGHLTPSLKIKRETVLRDFAPALSEIYDSGPATQENQAV
ncbi:AMP-dependent synthetase/ligase [Rhodoluna limnophila]|uniref:AMP-dependent synthetase/ligase n=1 Tax=Rhodoluna limnophila TaxID=232537 RepID=UPI0011074F2A|nr:AMP-dependent synthetase/ligase [Rhodoluna limnophila]